MFPSPQACGNVTHGRGGLVSELRGESKTVRTDDGSGTLSGSGF